MARSKTAFAVILVLLNISCSHVKLDPGDANYPIVDFMACGQSYEGLGICTLKAGQDFSAINLLISAPDQAHITFATDCATTNLTPSFVETTTKTVSFPLQGFAMNSCGVSFKISQRNHKPLEGQLYIKILPHNVDFVGITTKAPTGPEPESVLKIPSSDFIVNVVLVGEGNCAVKFDEDIISQNGYLPIRLRIVMPVIEQKTCILMGAAMFSDHAVRITWIISGYNSEFTPILPLSVPSDNVMMIAGDPY